MLSLKTKRTQKQFIFLAMFFLTACTSPNVVRIQTTPAEAEVSTIDSNGTSTLVGKTPLTGSESELYRNGNQYSHLKIKKEGFSEHEIVLTKSPQGSETSINIQLQKDEINSSKSDQSLVYEKIASAVARANGLVQSKQFEEAEAAMLNFTEQYPNVSVGFDYLGNINFLQKRYAKALKYYNRAMNLSPQNTERKMIMEHIQTLIKSQSGDAL